MDNTRAVIGALLIIGMIVFSNLILYAAVRGFTRGSSAHTGLSKAVQNLTGGAKKDTSYDDLRKRVEHLKDKTK